MRISKYLFGIDKIWSYSLESKGKSLEIKKLNFDSFNAFDVVHPDLYNQKFNNKSFLKKIFSNLKNI